ncbi:STAS/SEC14 domain-containing protein [Dokdonella sp.]|uniref:STAS/SEC14 domain-containing protein n=1 Tax=Dokdonella sp. TaxID=2291710 RepID=UPI002F3EE1D6
MIATLPAPPHLAAFRFDGSLTGEDFHVCGAEVERRLATRARINLFCDMSRHDGATLEEVSADIRAAFGRFGKIGRCAVVTQRPWVAAIDDAGKAMLPHAELRCFDAGEREIAMAWASEAPP